MSRVDEALKLAGESRRPEAVGSAAVLAFDQFPAETVLAARPDDAPQRVRAGESGRGVLTVPRTLPDPEFARLSPHVEGKIVVDDKMSPAAVEQYRRVVTSLLLIQGHRQLRTVMVSSALPRDGKSLTSANIAVTLSQSYKRKVLLIDGDIRRPSLHNVFKLPNSAGLADLLRPEVKISAPQIQVSPFLTVLTAGRTDEATMAGLTSERMRALLADATQHFEWVILDTPPVALVSDAHILASFVDGVVLVVGAGSTPFPAVQHAVSAFGHDRILGVVLNRVVSERKGDHGYYGEYYGRNPTQASP